VTSVQDDGQVIEAELVDDERTAGNLPAVPAQQRSDDGLVLSDEAHRLIAASIPPTTQRAYTRYLYGRVVRTTEDGRTVEDNGPAVHPWPEVAWVPWCLRTGRQSGIDGPATGVDFAEWVTELVRREMGAPTIEQARAAVRWLHDMHHHQDLPPGKLAGRVLAGYRALGAGKAQQQANAMTPRVVRRILVAMDEQRPDLPLLNQRDKVMLLLGVPGMLRRSELVDMLLDHVRVEDRGLDVFLPKSKTDKLGKGATISIPQGRHPETCAKTQFLIWKGMLAEHGLTDGGQHVICSVVRHGRGRRERLVGRQLDGRDVDRAVKRLVVLAGEEVAGWSAHSLRAGGATAAAEGGADLKEIMDQGRWISPATALRYIRRAHRWTQNAATKIDL
jgi:integrase